MIYSFLLSHLFPFSCILSKRTFQSLRTLLIDNKKLNAIRKFMIINVYITILFLCVDFKKWSIAFFIISEKWLIYLLLDIKLMTSDAFQKNMYFYKYLNKRKIFELYKICLHIHTEEKFIRKFRTIKAFKNPLVTIIPYLSLHLCSSTDINYIEAHLDRLMETCLKFQQKKIFDN